MKQLKITLLGQPHITLDEKAIESKLLRKSQALLFYLACNPTPQPRDSLAALLWSDMPDVQARMNLRTAIARLKKPFGEHLHIRRNTIGIRPNADSSFWCDVVHFRNGVETKRVDALEAAVKLYRGHFLSDFTVTNAPLFEEWMLTQRELLRQQVIEILTQLAHDFERQNNLERALAVTQQLLVHDPWRESAHRRLMRLWVAHGDEAAAIAQFQKCRHTLQVELGIEPAPATLTLYEQIRRGQLATTATQPSIRNNLPRTTTSFHGREAEIGRLRTLLADAGCRLVTIVGMGGIGKTRLALETAHQLLSAEQFTDGIYWVRLQTVTTRFEAVTTIASALELSLSGKGDGEQELVNFIKRKRVLLVLDNLEQFSAEANLLSDLLTQTEQLKLLVTSRERLDLYEEWLLPLQGLAYSEDLSVAAETPAVQLFVQRARRLNSQFAFAKEAEAVIRICQLVEGLPLGIELATAWTRTYTCAEVASNLLQLTVSTRNLPDRHRSLVAAFEHSWQLLKQKEQVVLARLACFRGGFSFDAAQVVAGASRSVLSSLVDKSLVQVGEGGRYNLHRVIEQLASEKQATIAANTQLSPASHAHAEYFLTHWLQNYAAIEQGDAKVINRLAADDGNLLAAWRNAPDQNVDLEPFAVVLSSYALVRAWFREGRERFLQAGKRPIFAYYAARFANRLGDYTTAQAELEEAVSKIDLEESPRLYADVRREQGLSLLYLGFYDEARHLLEQSAELYTLFGDERHAAITQGQLYLVYRRLGTDDAATIAIHNALEKLKSPRDRAYPLNYFGQMQLGLGNYEAAVAALSESRDIHQSMGHLNGIASATVNLAHAALRTGELDLAWESAENAHTYFDQMGEQFGIAVAHNAMGTVAYLRGHFEQARHHHLSEKAIYQQMENAYGNAFADHFLARIAAAVGEANALERFQSSLQDMYRIKATGPLVTNLVDVAQFFVEQGEVEKGLRVARFSAEHPNTEAFAITNAQKLLQAHPAQQITQLPNVEAALQLCGLEFPSLAKMETLNQEQLF